MNGKASKKFRKELSQAVKKTETTIAFKFKDWVNQLPVKDRCRIAWRILRGRF